MGRPINIRVLRSWRILKRLPLSFAREFFAPLWNRDQALAMLVSIVGTIIIFQQADAREMVNEVNEWGLAIHAFGWALVVWAGFMAIRSPFVAIADEKRNGSWHGGRFIYHSPRLIATLRCKATGQPQFHPIFFDDAEPLAFVYYSIEPEGSPPKHLYTADVVGGGGVVLLERHTEPGRGVPIGKSGSRIGKNKEAALLIVMQPDMVSQTFRVYLHDFTLGNPEDKDGDEGEFREPFRRAIEDDGRPLALKSHHQRRKHRLGTITPIVTKRDSP